MIEFFFFTFGLLIGSFCNVLIFRIKKSISIIKPASHCYSCKKKIDWKDNVPLISFLLLRGKCRKCKAKISWQYPIIEFLVGLTWFLVGFLYNQNFIEKLSISILWCLVFSALWVILVYDWKYMEIPMEVVYFSLILILIINFLSEDFLIFKNDFFSSQFFTNSLTGLVAFSFFFGLSFISNEQWMGYGDSFLALLIGLALDPVSSFFAILMAFCVGAIFSIFSIFLGKAGLKSQVPFGPFLIFSFFVIFFLKAFFPELFSSFI